MLGICRLGLSLLVLLSEFCGLRTVSAKLLGLQGSRFRGVWFMLHASSRHTRLSLAFRFIMFRASVFPSVRKARLFTRASHPASGSHAVLFRTSL